MEFNLAIFFLDRQIGKLKSHQIFLLYGILCEKKKKKKKRKVCPFGNFLVWYFLCCFFAPLGVLLVMKTLEDKQYVVLEAYKRYSDSDAVTINIFTTLIRLQQKNIVLDKAVPFVLLFNVNTEEAAVSVDVCCHFPARTSLSVL